MTIATTNTPSDQSSDAAFRIWIAEVITQLLAVGLTQTADTGQINTTTVTRPAVTNTSGGYVIFRFNDAAQATAPVFFKLEFGSGNPAPASPTMWITVGGGSNGSGTLTGLVMTRVSVCVNSTGPNNIATPVVSRFCYNTTAGFLGMVWKINSIFLASNRSAGGFFIYRSADSTGVVTTESVHLITNSSVAGATNAISFMQVISYLNSTVYNTGTWPTGQWGTWPLGLAASLFSTQASVGPVFQFTPVPGITPWAALALNSEFPIGNTTVTALVGATTHTFLSVGSPFGNSTQTALAYTVDPATAGSLTVAMLWE